MGGWLRCLLRFKLRLKGVKAIAKFVPLSSLRAILLESVALFLPRFGYRLCSGRPGRGHLSSRSNIVKAQSRQQAHDTITFSVSLRAQRRLLRLANIFSGHRLVVVSWFVVEKWRWTMKKAMSQTRNCLCHCRVGTPSYRREETSKLQSHFR